MIKKILFVSLILSGSPLWATAQASSEETASPVSSGQKQSMTIDQLFEKIEDNSKSLRTVKSGVEIASLGVESAKSKRLPDLDASLSFSYIGNALLTDRDFSDIHGLSSPHFGNNFAFQAQQVVYAGGAINAGIKLAELGKQQAEVGVRLTRQQVRFIAFGQYLDLFKIDNQIQVYEKNIELTRQLIADIKEKQSQGMALKNDITRYELQMESLKLGLTALHNNRNILNHQLCNTLGMNLEGQEVQIIPDTTVINKVYGKDGEAHWQIAGTMNSPLLEQSSNAIRIAEQKEKIAKSEMLPKVAFVAADNFDGPITFELPPIDKNLNIWYVGVGVKYSLSSLFKSNKRIKQAAVETRQAKESHAVQAEQLNNNVQAAYVQYQQTYVELETQQKSVELARQNYDVMNARYFNQLALVTDMVDASNLRLNAELKEVDARINIVYAYYRMMYVAGEI
ncbi:TolC family protein [uncultured Parabacteroides sp.]|uniref:TolC family protein n=1 Tax=uncultured Parabacteroides sp. TaxID=512312 RepID=UPI00280560CA|nr:TolC family protein [uncultured Parabacteroides sp.]